MGNNNYFWEDHWIRDKPLISFKILRKGTPWLKSIQGENISDYYSKKEGKWYFMDHPLPEVKNEIFNLLVELKKGACSMGEKKDKPIWMVSKK